MIPVASERDLKLIKYLSVLRGHTVSFCGEGGRNADAFSQMTQILRLIATENCFVTTGQEAADEPFHLASRTVYFFKAEGDRNLTVRQDDKPGKLYITELV